jgi:filamentous hemagglutinin family protein
MDAIWCRRAPRVKLFCALVASCFAAEGLANPTGPAVVSGSASFNTVGKSLTVTNSPNAIINWQGFSIGAGEATRFQQQGASSAVLNRVVGQDPSAILGTLWSNGKVFLVNPNGVLFGQGSRIDVAGLVASTLNITDRDFLAGRLNFQAGAVAGSIVNQGEIVSASGGRIYLIAPDVQNHGLISSTGGEVLLAAGKSVSLVDADVPNLKVDVQAGGEALNVGKILADGGKVGIYAGLINQRGIVRADSASKDATGRIVFKASDTTILDEGSVTSAAGAKGGEIQVLGNKVGLVGNARVDASGEAGGGTVLVGGDYQGANADVQNAYRTYVGPQSSIKADAITSGDGGKVVVWSDDATRAYGSISARGGAQCGNGGFVEVSGKNWLDFDSVVNTGAVRGSAGVLLLDPSQVNIVAGADTLSGGAGFDGGSPNNVFDGGSGPSSIGWTTIKNHLTGAGGGSNTNVYITTSGFQCSLAGSCGIDVLAASPDLASSNTLRLLSNQHINVSGSITNTGSGALEMYAGWNGASTTSPVLTDGSGVITISAPISFAGNVLLRAYHNIADTVGATITTPNLLASSSSASVNLSNSTHMVGTLAGTFHNQFQFKNGQALTIGTVDGTSGISTVPSAGGAPSLQVTVTTGNLIVNSPISVSDGGGTTATTSVTLHALNGGISVNNTTVNATAVADDSNEGQPASVALNAGGGGILVSNSTVFALGGNPITSGSGGSATVSLNATGGITANSASSINATGRAGLGVSAPGGNANINLIGGGTIDTSSSSLAALGGAPGSGGTAGIGSVLVAVNSSSGNPSPSGDIIVHNITADNVNLQQESLGVAKSILRASGTSLIGASQLLMEMDDPANVGGGSIGTSAAPMRVQVAKLEAHTHEASPGIFIDSPNAQNLQIGGVGINGGSVKGVQALAGGDISIGVNGTLSLLAGSANSPCGTGTGGPICATGGSSIVLLANDMNLAHSVAGGNQVTLQTYSPTGNLLVESSGTTGGVLNLTPAELANVTASALTLKAGNDLSLNADIGSFGTPRNQQINLIANNNALIQGGSVYVADFRSLTIAGNADGVGGGDLFIGGGATQVDVRAGSSTANNENMSLFGNNIFIAGSNGGFPTNVQLAGIGNQLISAASGVSIQGSAFANGGVFVQALSGTQAIQVTGGGLRVQSGTGNGSHAYLQAGTGQSVNAQYVEVIGQNSANDTSVMNVTSGLQVITTTGQNGANEGLLVNSAQLENMGDAGSVQIITVNNADHVRVIAQTRLAQIGAEGTQTITVSGASSLNSLEVSSAGAFPAQIAGANQNIAAGLSGQAGAISITGGSGDSQLVGIRSVFGSQIVSTSGTITIVGGTSAGPVGASASINNNFGLQTITANAINLQGGASGTNNSVAIDGSSGQVISVGSGGIVLGGGTGTGNTASIEQGSSSSTQAITVSGGTITLQGAGSGTSNAAQISGAGNQAISATGITLQGGATGSSNFALIATQGTQTITANNIALSGGNAGTSNFSSIVGPTQDITVHGDLTLIGGGSAPGTTGAGSRIGGLGGASPTPTNLLLSVDGNVSLTGGSVAGATGSAIGSSQSASAQPTTIAMDVGGDITLTAGSASGVRIGSSSVNPSNGNISITAGGNVTLKGSSTIRTLGALAIDVTGALVLTGANSGSGQTANIFSAGNQTIAAGSITLNGGDAGGADLSGNTAQISSGGLQIITTDGDLALKAGAGGINNFASITAPTQIVTVHGNLSLTGGGSTTSLDGTIGGGARIGGPGGASPAPTNLTLGVDGNVHLTGGTLANAGSAIGSGTQGGQATTISMTAGGNVILDPGTVTNGGSRIGSPASNVADGDISITAGGTLALNSTGPGLGTAIRTLGNLTITAGSMTQGPDSQIIAGGTTTLNGGTILLTSAHNDFTGAVSLNINFQDDVAITDANAIILGTANLGTGALSVTAGGPITQTGPIIQANAAGQATFAAGANPITLANPANDFSGPVNLSGSSASINDFSHLNFGTLSLGGGSLVVSATSIADSGPITAGAGSFNARGGPILLNNMSSTFTGAVNLTGTSVQVLTSNPITLGAVHVTDLNLSANTISQDSSGVVVTRGASLRAGSVMLNTSTNDFGQVEVVSAGNVALTDRNAITVIASSVGGAFSVNAPIVNFEGGLSANNYSFSGGTHTLAAGTYNLGGTTTVASSATVTASGATINAAGGTMNVSGTFSALGGSVTVGTLNVLAGGALTGAGTIIGTVNNSAGTVSPGASPGILTITGNYVQGASGTLAMQIGGLIAGSEYDQLVVGGTTSLAGTLTVSLIGSFVPPPGSTYTLIQGSGPLSGAFTTVNQPAGALFNTFYRPTTFEFIAGGGGGSLVPQPIEPSFNQSIVSIEQVFDVLFDRGLEEQGILFAAGVVAPATTTTPDGKIVPKPPACN